MTREKPAKVDLDPRVTQVFARTFIPRTDIFPLQQPNGRYIQLKCPLSPTLIENHLIGMVTLGAYALDENSQAQWLCLDADDEQQWQGLVTVAQSLQQSGITPYLELSRRGGHLWLFFKSLPGWEARRFGQYLIDQHGLGKVELYPKQDRLLDGAGSLVRLPFGIHRKTNRRYHFISPEGESLAPTIRSQLAILARPKLIPQEYIRFFAQNIPAPKPVSPTPKFEKAAPIMSGTLSETLKQTVSVYHFVSQFVPLDNQAKGICPFHDDHVKSFQVNVERNYWNCYAGCGGGSLIDFWMKWRETHGQDGSFSETVKELRKMVL